MAMSEESVKTVFKSAFHFLSGTLISRATGLLRDLSMAWCFGSHPAIAAFMVAFRFSNLMRRLFGEGQMGNGFIPHFESLRATSKGKEADFFRDLFYSLSCVLVFLICVIEIGLYFWMKSGVGQDTAQILLLTMLMLPGILFICLFGLGAALLQCEKQFFLSGFSPVAFNLVWIGAVWWLKGEGHESAVISLSLAIVFAYFMQWMMTVPKTLKFFKEARPLKEFFRPRLFSEEMRRVILPFFMGAIGIGALQVSSALDALFARFASLEGPAYLWYAIRIQQFPLALFGIAIASALLPSFSRAIEAGQWERFRHLLHTMVTRSFTLILPAAFGILILGASGVNLLYGHGDFTQEATKQTLLCLWGYGIGLFPAVMVLFLAPAFYAQKDFKTPMKAALLSVGLGLLLNALMVFVFKWGAFSIALVTSFSGFFNFFYLKGKLVAKTGPIFTRDVLRNFIKIFVCTLTSSALTLFFGTLFFQDPTLAIVQGNEALFSRSLSEQLIHFASLSGFFLVSLFALAWLFRIDEVFQLLGLKKQKLPE